MKSALHILLIEDSSHDACLIEQELTDATIPFRLTMIESESQLRRELLIDRPDLILSDHNLPSFDGFTALQIVRKQFPRMPFIFVSGSNDQQMVMDMFDCGATDYVFKGDINDLRLAVYRAVDDCRVIPAAESESMPGSAAPSDAATGPGQLIFCPKCLKAWDENGRETCLEDYAKAHVETSVLRQVCMKCGEPRRF
jgi:DNA-binding NtrC family response regulator